MSSRLGARVWFAAAILAFAAVVAAVLSDRCAEPTNAAVGPALAAEESATHSGALVGATMSAAARAAGAERAFDATTGAPRHAVAGAPPRRSLTVRGAVRAAGAPLGAVEVRLVAPGVDARALTGDDGRFELPWEGPAVADVIASASGYVAARRAGVDVTAPIDLELARAASWIFHVPPASGRDGGIQVWRQTSGDSRGWDAVDVREDAPGRFVAHGLAPGDYAWQARFGEGVSPYREGVRLAAGEVRSETVSLAIGATLDVRVRDAAGRAVADARVSVRRDEPSRPAAPRQALGRDATSDVRGEARFSGLEGGAWTVAVWAPSGSRAQTRPRVRDGEVTVVEVAVPAALAVRGTVVDPAGAPVAGALVRLAGAPLARLTHADGAGEFKLDDVPSGARLRLAVEPPSDDARGLGPAWVEPRRQDAPVRVVLPRIAELRGLVLGAEGAPIAGARVSATIQGARGGRSQAHSDADGSFVVASVPHGSVRLSVTAEGHLPATVDVAHPAPGGIAPIRLDPEARIHGIARTERGEAPAGVRVRLVQHAGADGVELPRGERRSTTDVACDEFGRFTSGGLSPGGYELSIVSQHWSARERVHVTLGAGEVRDVELELVAREVAGRAIVRGFAVAKQGGGAVEGLWLGGLRGGTLVHRGSAFERSGVAPGRARISIGAPGLRALDLGDVDVLAGGEHDLGTLVLESGITLIVEVVDEQGRLQTGGVRVELAPRAITDGGPDPAAPRISLGRAGSRFRTTEAAPGRWRIRVQHPQRETVSRPLTLPHEGPLRIVWGKERT